MILCNTFSGLYSTKKEKVLKNLFNNCFNLAKLLSMFKVFWITITLTTWSTYKKKEDHIVVTSIQHMERIDQTCFLETRHKELSSWFYLVRGTNILVASNRSCNWTALFSFVYKKKKKI